MTIRAIEVMSRDEALEFRTRVEQLRFVDGVASAGPARHIKHNTQAVARDQPTTEMVDELTALLFDLPGFRQIAFPRHFGRVAFNRYGPGDAYGLHVDSAFVGPFATRHRTDLSFTLFLSDPSDYEGGELHIADGLSSPRVKLPAGRMALYPTGLMHEVTPVTEGVRWAVIGWIESWIADPVLREIVAKTQTLQRLLESQPVPAPAKLMMQEIAQEILRYGSR